MTSSVWTLAVSRGDLSRTRVIGSDLPELSEGQALLRVDRVAVTANNVTYAVLGTAFRYWDFFPTRPDSEGDWGCVPVWGFAEVVASRTPGVAEGDRFYGCLPAASHLLVHPDAVDDSGFRDASPHRAGLPSPYAAYARAATTSGQEDLEALLRPLFWTAWLLADQLADGGDRAAGTVVLSSASSKTASAAAWCLRGSGRQVVGLTSARNRAFVEGLGCYDRVLSYGEVDRLDAVPTLYADLAGDAVLSTTLRRHLGDHLVGELVVGITHQDAAPAQTLAETGPTVFFAPTRMRQRQQDWGREELDRRFAAAWAGFLPVAQGWVDVQVAQGPSGLEQVWREVQAGRADPRTGHVVAL